MIQDRGHGGACPVRRTSGARRCLALGGGALVALVLVLPCALAMLASAAARRVRPGA